MKKLLLSFSFLLASAFVYSQIMFERTYGGPLSDNANCVIQVSDGGYVILGSTESYGAGQYDIYLIKTNDYGDTIWTRTYGGVNTEYGMSVQQTSDGGYFIVGSTSSFGHGGFDVYLIKTDANGNSIWTRTIGGPNTDYGMRSLQTFDGGYFIVGETSSFGVGTNDMYFIRTDSFGDTLWTKTYGGNYGDWIGSALQTSDGGFIIVGTSQPVPNYTRIHLIKTDSNGNTMWAYTYGDGFNNIYFGKQIVKTSEGGYIIVGNKDSDILLLKTDINGNQSWQKTYGKQGYDDGRSIAQTNDGGYLIAGFMESLVSGNYEACIMKTNANGDSIWTKLYGNGFTTLFSSLALTNDGGYIFAGSQDVSQDGPNDVYLVKTNAFGIVGVKEGNLINNNAKIYPNPFSTSTQISFDKTYQTLDLSLIDLQGKIIQQKSYHDCNKITLDRAGIANGFYFLRVSLDGKFVETKKVVVTD